MSHTFTKPVVAPTFTCPSNGVISLALSDIAPSATVQCNSANTIYLDVSNKVSGLVKLTGNPPSGVSITLVAHNNGFDFGTLTLNTATLQYSNLRFPTSTYSLLAGVQTFGADNAVTNLSILIPNSTCPSAITVNCASLTDFQCGSISGFVNPAIVNWNFNGCALTQSSVDNMLAKLDTLKGTVSAFSLNLSGGSNAAPTIDLPETYPNVAVTFQSAGSFTQSGNGDYLDLFGTARLWFNFGSNNAPDSGGLTLTEVDCTSGDDASTIASNAQSQLFGSLSGTLPSSGVLHVTYSVQSSVGSCATNNGGALSLANEVDTYTPASNSHIQSIFTAIPSATITTN